MVSTKKEVIFLEIARDLKHNNFIIDEQDLDRPWGGFYKIDESQAERFVQSYFPHLDVESLKITGRISPKILIVAPFKRLSWQYHLRRAEIWRVLQGNVGVIASDTDVQGAVRIMQVGDIIQLKERERHRLVGLDDWGVLAEIWQHTHKDAPSNEDDIIRLDDDFGR